MRTPVLEFWLVASMSGGAFRVCPIQDTTGSMLTIDSRIAVFCAAQTRTIIERRGLASCATSKQKSPPRDEAGEQSKPERDPLRPNGTRRSQCGTLQSIGLQCRVAGLEIE